MIFSNENAKIGGDLFDQNVYGFKNKYVIGMIGRCQHLQ